MFVLSGKGELLPVLGKARDRLYRTPPGPLFYLRHAIMSGQHICETSLLVLAGFPFLSRWTKFDPIFFAAVDLTLLLISPDSQHFIRNRYRLRDRGTRINEL